MACIMNIDSSTKVCSVALAENGKLLFDKEDRTSAQHAALLGVFVAEAMDYVRKNGLRLDAVAVSSGPGSYTGLRIGVSEAKGLCYGLDIPLIAIPTLEIMANEVIRSDYKADFYCPMIDARRMEVYTAVYNKNLQVLSGVSAEIIDEKAYTNYLSEGKILFFGDGAAKCKPVIQSDNAIFLDDIVPLASSMVYLSEMAFDQAIFEDLAYFEPFYLKEFVATVAKNKVLS